jgi:hypothetical protein
MLLGPYYQRLLIKKKRSIAKLTSTIDSIIRWKDDGSFNIDINLTLRKANVDGMTCYVEYIRIWFMNDTGLNIDIPNNLDNLLKVIERDLLSWSGYREGYILQGHVVERIIDHLKANIMEIKEAIEKTK